MSLFARLLGIRNGADPARFYVDDTLFTVGWDAWLADNYDEQAEVIKNTVVLWPQGERTSGGSLAPFAVGTYPVSGAPQNCSPAGLRQYESAVGGTLVSTFAASWAPRVAAANWIDAYTSPPPLTWATDAPDLDSWYEEFVDAGMGIQIDVAGACDRTLDTPAKLSIDRLVAQGRRVAVEPMNSEQFDELSGWYTNPAIGHVSDLNRWDFVEGTTPGDAYRRADVIPARCIVLMPGSFSLATRFARSLDMMSRGFIVAVETSGFSDAEKQYLWDYGTAAEAGQLPMSGDVLRVARRISRYDVARKVEHMVAKRANTRTVPR